MEYHKKNLRRKNNILEEKNQYSQTIVKNYIYKTDKNVR